jgi:hypothetical protein
MRGGCRALARERRDRDRKQQFAGAHRAGRTPPCQLRALALHQDGGEQALRFTRQHVEIEANQFIAGTHHRSQGHAWFESPSLERDRIDADVDQYLNPIRRAQRNGMAGSG